VARVVPCTNAAHGSGGTTVASASASASTRATEGVQASMREEMSVENSSRVYDMRIRISGAVQWCSSSSSSTARSCHFVMPQPRSPRPGPLPLLTLSTRAKDTEFTYAHYFRPRSATFDGKGHAEPNAVTLADGQTITKEGLQKMVRDIAKPTLQSSLQDHKELIGVLVQFLKKQFVTEASAVKAVINAQLDEFRSRLQKQDAAFNEMQTVLAEATEKAAANSGRIEQGTEWARSLKKQLDAMLDTVTRVTSSQVEYAEAYRGLAKRAERDSEDAAERITSQGSEIEARLRGALTQDRELVLQRLEEIRKSLSERMLKDFERQDARVQEELKRVSERLSAVIQTLKARLDDLAWKVPDMKKEVEGLQRELSDVSPKLLENYQKLREELTALATNPPGVVKEFEKVERSLSTTTSRLEELEEYTRQLHKYLIEDTARKNAVPFSDLDWGNQYSDELASEPLDWEKILLVESNSFFKWRQHYTEEVLGQDQPLFVEPYEDEEMESDRNLRLSPYDPKVYILGYYNMDQLEKLGFKLEWVAIYDIVQQLREYDDKDPDDALRELVITKAFWNGVLSYGQDKNEEELTQATKEQLLGKRQRFIQESLAQLKENINAALQQKVAERRP